MTRKVRIVCFGDSITYGFPYGPEYSWIHYVAKNNKLEMMNAGENGDTAEDLIKRFSTDVAVYRPDFTFLMIGTNDASIGLPVEVYAKMINNLLELIIHVDSRPLLGLPVPSSDPELEQQLSRYRGFLCDTAQRAQIPILDFGEILVQNKFINDKYYLDEVHPNAAGHKAMGLFAATFFEKLI